MLYCSLCCCCCCCCWPDSVVTHSFCRLWFSLVGIAHCKMALIIIQIVLPPVQHQLMHWSYPSPWRAYVMNAEKNKKPFGTLSLLISSCKIEMVAQREKKKTIYISDCPDFKRLFIQWFFGLFFFHFVFSSLLLSEYIKQCCHSVVNFSLYRVAQNDGENRISLSIQESANETSRQQ